MVSDANKSIPILQCHGDIDPMVPFTWGNMTATILKQLNPRHEIRRLSGVMHSSSEEVSTYKYWMIYARLKIIPKAT